MNAKTVTSYQPRNKGKLVGQKSPLRLRDIWGIRIRLKLAQNVRDLALFDLAIDSKLRACDLTKLRVRDVAWKSRCSQGNGDAAEDETARPIRDHSADAARCGGMGTTGWTQKWRFPAFKSA